MKMSKDQEEEFKLNGFVELKISDETVFEYSDGCSGGRSDCCTRVCSQDQNFVSSEKDWEQFLEVKGGQVQY